MQIRFDGKTVVVSGAGHGFGRCIAETFAGLGARVFGCDLSAAELAETAKAGVSTEVLDLTDRAAAAAWIVEIEQTTGGAVDVLVNNSGGVAGQEMQPIEELECASAGVFQIHSARLPRHGKHCCPCRRPLLGCHRLAPRAGLVVVQASRWAMRVQRTKTTASKQPRKQTKSRMKKPRTVQLEPFAPGALPRS